VSRFGVCIQPGGQPRVEAWGELCMSTVPDLQACVLGAMQECPGDPLVLDLRRVWFCDLAGLRALWWLGEHGERIGTEVEVLGSDAIVRIGRLVDDLRAARIA
jgi:anti-anti-sigma regulatory factor